ncbi:MAG: hypothetical protein JWN73_2629 [Betaproteobacteria bacterium]|nr:hypothetical protein [Betaproteobacteria bacterium]
MRGWNPNVIHEQEMPPLSLLRHLAAVLNLLQCLPLAAVFGATLLSGAFDIALFFGWCALAPLANVLAMWPLQRWIWASGIAVALNLLWILKFGFQAILGDPSDILMWVILAMFPQSLALLAQGIAFGLHLRGRF